MYIRPYEEYFMGLDDYVVHRYILLIVPPILLTIGSFGNILSFCILIKHTNKSSTNTFLSALSLADLLVLYVGLLRIWLGQFMTDILDTNNIVCKVWVFLGFTCSDISVWIIVAVTVERFLVVTFPLKAPILCNTRNARFTIICILFIFMAVNIHFFWTVELHHYFFDTVVVSKCEAKLPFTNLVEVLWPWVDAAIYSFVPFITIMILNSFIIMSIISARQSRTVLRQQTSLSATKHVQYLKRKQEESSKRISVMLLVVSFTFLITTLPMNLILIFTSFSNQSDSDGDKIFAKWKLVRTSTEMLMYVNHSINFFLYCITGKKFRGHFKRLISSPCMSTVSEVVAGSSRRLSTTSLKTTKIGFVQGIL